MTKPQRDDRAFQLAVYLVTRKSEDLTNLFLIQDKGIDYLFLNELQSNFCAVNSKIKVEFGNNNICFDLVLVGSEHSQEILDERQIRSNNGSDEAKIL